ncbi:MAG: alpha/beta hydrolase [Dehalococcoidia bacterium]
MTAPTPPATIEPYLDADHLEAYRATTPALLDPADLAGAVQVLRARSAARQAAVGRAVRTAGVTAEDRAVPGPEGAPPVPVRVYRGARTPATGAAALLWIHGGGMVMGDIDQSDAYCTDVAHRLGVVVVSTDYRVAPEHPFPAPLEDCYASLRWLAQSADALGVDAARIAIGGSSAGAGLAAGLALLARDRGEVPVCYQHLIYPMLDDRNVTASSHRITDPRVWNRTSNLAGWHAYLAGRAGTEDVSPYAAPARATDLAGLPPAYITVGTLDLFMDEDVEYARRLVDAGVRAELRVYPGVFHASPTYIPNAAVSRRWTADQREALARGLGVTVAD